MAWKYIIVHHTGAEEKNTAQIRSYHRRLGWRDIGYHFVIEKNGLLVPGRVQSERGAHCVAGGMNAQALGVALIGNFEQRRPHPEQLATLRELLSRLMREHRIPAARVLGHGEVNGAATLCPGRHLDLAALRQALAAAADPAQTLYRVQVGAFRDRARAAALAARLRQEGYDTWVRSG